MGTPVGNIVKLVGPDRTIGFSFVQRLRQTPGITHIVVRIAVRGRWHFNQLRTRQAQHVFLFLALRFGDHNHRFESHRRANQCEANASVPCRAFNNCATGLQMAFVDRVFDDVERRAVLNRLTRVHKLGFAQDGAACDFAGFAQLDEWRVADSLGQILCKMHVVSHRNMFEIGVGVPCPELKQQRAIDHDARQASRAS